MACVTKQVAFVMFVAGIMLLVVCIAVAGNDAVAPSPKQEKETVTHWVERAEQYAAGLSESQLIKVLPTLCGVMVEADKAGKIDHLLAIIKDPKKRADQGIMVCMALGLAGKCDAAIRRAQLLPTERRTTQLGERFNSWRDGAIHCVALAQSSAYDFAAAKKTIGLIDDSKTVSAAYCRLAEYQAKAGLYAEAEENLEKFVPINEDGKKWKEETRQQIARYKAKRRKDPPRKRSMNCFDSFRRVSTIFADTGIEIGNLADAEKAEKEAEKVEGAENKATACREIAWAYYDMRGEDKNNLERCSRAIEKSVQNAEKISDGIGMPYLRAVAFASAANLYLELGETETAKQMVQKADAVNLAEDMLGGLNAFTTTPLLIAILVRVGDIDGAMAIAEKLQKVADGEGDEAFPTNPDIAWLFWAIACTLEGKTECVERQLEKTSNAQIETILCAGVAQGLLELQEQEQKRNRKEGITDLSKPDNQ